MFDELKSSLQLTSEGKPDDGTLEATTDPGQSVPAKLKKAGDEEMLSSLDAERQIKFNEALNKAVAERDGEIERLIHRQTVLLQDIDGLKGFSTSFFL